MMRPCLYNFFYGLLYIGRSMRPIHAIRDLVFSLPTHIAGYSSSISYEMVQRIQPVFSTYDSNRNMAVGLRAGVRASFG